MVKSGDTEGVAAVITYFLKSRAAGGPIGGFHNPFKRKPQFLKAANRNIYPADSRSLRGSTARD
jgi:hypothetical protein